MLLLPAASPYTPEASLLQQALQHITVFIQGTGTEFTTDITINTVVLANTRIRSGGLRCGSTATASSASVRWRLKDTTTVEITVGAKVPTNFNGTLVLTVCEFISGVLSAMQRGTIAVTSTNLTNTGAISASSVTMSEVVHNGFTCDYITDYNVDNTFTLLKQNSTTQIEAQRGAGGGNLTVGYEVATYASTYVDLAENKVCTIPASCAMVVVPITNVNIFAQDIVPSWAGQKCNPSITDLGDDSMGLLGVGPSGITVGRNATKPAQSSVCAVNVVAFKPGYMRRKCVANKLIDGLINIEYFDLEGVGAIASPDRAWLEHMGLIQDATGTTKDAWALQSNLFYADVATGYLARGTYAPDTTNMLMCFSWMEAV